MEKILLDTNFLLLPYQFKVDIFTQIDRIMLDYKLFVLDKTIDELKSILLQQKGKDKDAAKIALKLVSLKNIGILKTDSNKKTDEIIAEVSFKEGFVVATQDKELRQRLREKNIPVIILRKKKVVRFLNC
ncbi:hypothetical protein HYX01_00730 [Candidatus Woesearchaeota archaeon]|nr:hypothetical protein [Candidatus Woesearchaeota archaeon]